MDGSYIGIRVANGGFFPIAKAGDVWKKKMLLTTATENQELAHIELVLGIGVGEEGGELKRQHRLGALSVEGINPGPAGSPEIELLLSLSEDGKLQARAVDRDTGAHQSLSVFVPSDEAIASEAQAEELPDFDADEDFGSLPDLGPVAVGAAPEDSAISEDFPGLDSEVAEEQQFGIPDSESHAEAEPVSNVRRLEDDEPWRMRSLDDDEEGTKGSGSAADSDQPRWRTPLLVALAALAVLGIAFIVYLLVSGEPAPAQASIATPSPVPTATPTPSPSPTPSPQPSISPSPVPAAIATAKPSSAKTTPKPVASSGFKVAREVEYRIRWGDTLWDLANEFYGNPWLYPKIAKANSIKNPNLIISGRKIKIPAR